MSLMRIALRISAVEALRGNTFAGNNILDSEIGAIDIATGGGDHGNKAQPFISVYTGEASGHGNKKDFSELFGAYNCDLVFDAAVSAQMAKRDSDGDIVSNLPVVPRSDSSYEVALDVLQYQIFQAINDPKNEWADICRSCTYTGLNSVEVSVGRANERTRIAARQIRVSLNVIADPLQLDESNEKHVFQRFLSKLEEGSANPDQDEDFKGLAESLRSIVNKNYNEFDLSKLRYGMTNSDVDSLQLFDIQESPIGEITSNIGTVS